MSAQETVTLTEEAGFKVFCGNLAFSTTDAELTTVFGAVGEISNAQIINRGARSLGYGFITFVHEADALKAVAQLDKSEISGRQVNVEIAKPAAPVVPRAAAAPVEEVLGEDGLPIPRAPKKAGRGRTKAARGGRRPRTDGETEEAGDAPVDDVTSQLASTTLDSNHVDAPAGAARGGRRGGRGGRAGGVAGAAPIRRGPPTGEPSKTLLFVANLPFSVTDEGLTTIFADYKLVSARVVVKKFGPGEGRSKGFGFVELANEEEQLRALEKVQGHEVDGREIMLKVAIGEAKEDEPEALIVAS